MLKFLYSIYYLYAKLFRPLCVGARIILEKDGKIIFVKHTYKDYYYPPGGGVKRNESLEDCVIREAKEEVGADIKSLKLIDVLCDFSEKRDYVGVFYSDEFNLFPVKSNEIAEIVGLNNFLVEEVHPVWRNELLKLKSSGKI